MRVLAIGDVIGKPGRRAVAVLLPNLRRELKLDLVIANGENAAGGFGITAETAEELLESGVDVLTSGNHIYDQKDIVPHLDGQLPLIRPINYPTAAPGRGYIIVKDTLVVNAIGRVFVGTFDCPFRAMDQLLSSLNPLPRVILVDFHAEATSEKVAFGWYLDGRISAVFGTHTHVPTADARLLPRGTAYVSDLGMVGPVNSVIGNDPRDVMERFLTQVPVRLRVPGGPVIFNSVMVEIDENTGKTVSMQRIDQIVEQP